MSAAPKPQSNYGIVYKHQEGEFKKLSDEERFLYLWRKVHWLYEFGEPIESYISPEGGDPALSKQINSDLNEIRTIAEADPQMFKAIPHQIAYFEEDMSSGSIRSDIYVGNTDPVNLYNGNFVYSNTDLTIYGAGIDFVFRRTYANQALYNGPLGNKWDHSYNLWLRITAGFNIIYRSTGLISESVYRRHNIHQYWLTESGEEGVITQTNNGFIWHSNNGTEFHYSSQLGTNEDVWLITQIIDRFGNYLKFHYDDDDRLTRVLVNHLERELTFVYDDGDKKIKEIIDFFDRHWFYIYDDLSDLIAVTTPSTEQYKHGLITRYEYTTTIVSDPVLQHNLIAIIDMNGHIFLENEYGSNPGLQNYNRVILQRQGSGETIFDYQDIVEESNFSYEVYQRPTHQTIVTERNGNSVCYMFNSFGNMVFEEKYARINGLPKLISTHYRYNKDGNLIGTISPEGVITQFLYGRDYFNHKWNIGQDYRDIDDENLDSKTRLGFNKLLATVRRGRYYSIHSLNLSQGLWTNIFPEIYDTSEKDIIQKFSYEEDYGQPITISHPQYTGNADPDFAEREDYFRHLTRYKYQHNAVSEFHLLHKIESPSITSPDGTVSGPIVAEMALYDHRGRILETIGPNGLVTHMSYYDPSSGPLEGFLKETHLDPDQLSIKMAVDRDLLGRVIRKYSPKFFDGTDDKFVTETEFNALNQTLSITSTSPFKFKLQRRYNRVGNIIQESFDHKRSDGTPFEEPLLIVKYDYDEEFHIIKETIGGGDYLSHKKNRFVYDIAGRIVITISPSGRKSKLYYNERSLVSKRVIDHGGIAATEKRYYDGDSRLILVIDPNGSETKFVYDSLGRLIENEDALGNKKLFTYDKVGNVLIERFFEIHADGFRLLYRFEYNYDELGRRINIGTSKFEGPIEVAGDIRDIFVQQGPGELLTTSYFYDNNGNIIKEIDPSGHEFITEYDKMDRITKRTDPYGNEITNQYDRHENLIRSDIEEVVRNPTNNGIIGHRYFATAFTYDELDRLITRTDSLGNVVHYKYDSLNQMTSVIDPLSNTIESDYDIYGRIIQTSRLLKDQPGISSAINVRDLHHYDLEDSLIQKIDAQGRITKFQYDSMGRLISTILPDGSQDKLVYDRSSNIINYMDRNGLLLKYNHDLLGRVITLQIDETNLMPGVEVEGSSLTNYLYDGIGRTIYTENAFCKYSTSYNSLGWLTREDNIYIHPDSSSIQLHFVLERFYDLNGELSDIVYPAGRKLHYNRDILGRITSVKQMFKGLDYPGDIGISEPFVLMTIEYEGLQRKRISRQNQTSTEFLYDRGGRMIEIKHNYKNGLLSQFQYLYDAVGNVLQKTEASAETDRTSVFNYDSLYRIRDISKVEIASINNLESLHPATAPIPEVIPDSQSEIDVLIDQNIPKVNEYAYDSVGNRLTKKEENLLVEQYITNDLDQYSFINGNLMKYDKMGNLIDDEKWEYKYNFRNQLSSIRQKDNDQITRFYHDPLSRKILEIRNNETTLLVYDTWNVIEEYDDNDLHSSIVSDEGIDNIVQISVNNANFWSYSDIIKSVIHIMEGDEKDQHYEYDEFGEIITPIQDGVIANRFSGKRLIPELEKYDFVFRSYDPKIGRFLQRDPKEYVEGSNLYTYASNNPLSKTDPFGTYSRYDTLGGSSEYHPKLTDQEFLNDLNKFIDKDKNSFVSLEEVISFEKGIGALKLEFGDELTLKGFRTNLLVKYGSGKFTLDLPEQRALEKQKEPVPYTGPSVSAMGPQSYPTLTPLQVYQIKMSNIKNAHGAVLLAPFTRNPDRFLEQVAPIGMLMEAAAGVVAGRANIHSLNQSIGIARRPNVYPSAGGQNQGNSQGNNGGGIPELIFDYNNPKQMEIADNIWHAQKAGHPNILTHGGDKGVNRFNALERDYRIPRILTRDEYPFASSIEGGRGSWVGHVIKVQNDSQGGSIGRFLAKFRIQPGQRYRVKVINHPGGTAP